MTQARFPFSERPSPALRRLSASRALRAASRWGAAALAVCVALGPETGTARTAAAQGGPPAPATSTNLQVTTASYLGSGATLATAVDVAPDGTTVLGGLLVREPGEPGDPAGGAPATPPAVSLLGGGNGLVVRLAGTTANTTAGASAGASAAAGSPAPAVLSTARLPGAVEDLKVNSAGQIVACGEFGIALLDATAAVVLWADRPGTVRRCALADDGTAAGLAGSSVYVYGPSGTPLAAWSVGGTMQNDVALDPQRGLVFATGHTNRRTSAGEPVQVAFLKAWTTGGVAVWTAYDAPGDRLGASPADTRGVRVSLGRDGKLYFAGESAGGNSLFGRQPRSATTGLRDDQLVQIDVFTNATFNTPRNHITWFGRYNPADGGLERGQFVLARLEDANLRGNTIRPRSIAADEEGRVYLAGATNASIEGRDVRTISGAAVGPYGGGEAFLMVVQPDLRRRVVWTTFTAPNPLGADPTHDSVATAVGVRNGVAALAATVLRGALLTFNPLPGAPIGAPIGTSAAPAGPSGTLAPPPVAASPTVPATPSAPAATGTVTSGPAVTTATSTLRTPAGATALRGATSTAGGVASPSAAPSPAGGTPAATAEPITARAYVAVWPRSGEAAAVPSDVAPSASAGPGGGVFAE